MINLSKNKKKQKGVALFMTLLIVSIATLISSEMWFNNNLDVSRQFNNRSSYQAMHYSRGMILWAKDILRQDYQENSNYDTNSDVWNRTITGIEVEDAFLSGKLNDLSGKFNLNNLSIADSQASKDLFLRILNELELEQSLADKIIDWLDADSIPLELGAEDISYSIRKPYLKTAGQAFRHISELRLVDGVTEESYQRLKQYVTVLPVINNTPTKINVNTTSLLILNSLDSRISINYARALYNDGQANFQTLSDFFEHNAIRNYFLGEENLQRIELQKLLDTKTQWFHAIVKVSMENSVYQRFALLQRNSAVALFKEWSLTSYE